MLARAVATSGGEWDAPMHKLMENKGEIGGPLPPAEGWRGMDIHLTFTPGKAVDAESIGLTQTVQSVAGGAPEVGPRGIPGTEAKPIPGRKGETDEGTQIDRIDTYNNPMYGVASPASTSLADGNMRPGVAQPGWRFTDGEKKVQQQEARMLDKPRQNMSQRSSRQVF